MSKQVFYKNIAKHNMKRQIRNSVFETNSSSQHSISVMNLDKFNDWKAGKVLARVVSDSEDEHCWGNFWSDMYTWECTDDFEQAKIDNENAIKIRKEKELAQLEKYKNECLNHIKLVKKELSDEEFINLPPDEAEQYDHDSYVDSLYEFNEKMYNELKEAWENLTLDNVFDEIYQINVIDGEFWITYEQYEKDFLNIDCYSPFNHDDKENNLHIFGKYFHS